MGYLPSEFVSERTGEIPEGGQATIKRNRDPPLHMVERGAGG